MFASCGRMPKSASSRFSLALRRAGGLSGGDPSRRLAGRVTPAVVVKGRAAGRQIKAEESERSRVERLHIGAVPHNHIRFGSSLSPRAITVIEHGGLVRGGARCAAGTSRLPLQPLQCAPVRAQETLVRPLAKAWRSASPFLRTSPFKLHQRRPLLG